MKSSFLRVLVLTSFYCQTFAQPKLDRVEQISKKTQICYSHLQIPLLNYQFGEAVYQSHAGISCTFLTESAIGFQGNCSVSAINKFPSKSLYQSDERYYRPLQAKHGDINLSLSLRRYILRKNRLFRNLNKGTRYALPTDELHLEGIRIGYASEHGYRKVETGSLFDNQPQEIGYLHFEHGTGSALPYFKANFIQVGYFKCIARHSCFFLKNHENMPISKMEQFSVRTVQFLHVDCLLLIKESISPVYAEASLIQSYGAENQNFSALSTTSTYALNYLLKKIPFGLNLGWSLVSNHYLCTRYFINLKLLPGSYNAYPLFRNACFQGGIELGIGGFRQGYRRHKIPSAN